LLRRFDVAVEKPNGLVEGELAGGPLGRGVDGQPVDGFGRLEQQVSHQAGVAGTHVGTAAQESFEVDQE
jgi:hypothetical protein